MRSCESAHQRSESEEITVTNPRPDPKPDNPSASETPARSFNVGAGRRERSTGGRRPEVVKLRHTEAERGELTAHAEQRGITARRYLLECAAAVQASGAIETAIAAHRPFVSCGHS